MPPRFQLAPAATTKINRRAAVPATPALRQSSHLSPPDKSPGTIAVLQSTKHTSMQSCRNPMILTFLTTGPPSKWPRTTPKLNPRRRPATPRRVAQRFQMSSPANTRFTCTSEYVCHEPYPESTLSQSMRSPLGWEEEKSREGISVL